MVSTTLTGLSIQKTYTITVNATNLAKKTSISSNQISWATSNKDITDPWDPNDVVFMVWEGQSNSYGHGTTLACDAYTTPLENVFTLTKANNPLSKTDGVVWTKHQSNVDNNRGTLAIAANFFAKK